MSKTPVSPITRATRKASYEKTNRNFRQQAVLDMLREHGEMTAREIAERLYKNGCLEYPARALVQPRLTELVQVGLVEVCDKKLDEETKRVVAVYRAVDYVQQRLF